MEWEGQKKWEGYKKNGVRDKRREGEYGSKMEEGDVCNKEPMGKQDADQIQMEHQVGRKVIRGMKRDLAQQYNWVKPGMTQRI